MKNKAQFIGNWKKNYVLFLFLLPALIYVAIFAYAPMYGLLLAFKNYRTNLGIWHSPWVGLKHFIRFLEYPDTWNMVRNTLSISLYQMLVFPIPAIFALMINELRNDRVKRSVQMITYSPHFISTVVLGSMILLFFNRSSGLVNNIIEALGGKRIDFLSLPESFYSMYVWSGVWQNLGWDAIIYLAALSGVSRDCVEAAQIDGASRLKIIRHVNLPHIIPTIVIVFILQMGQILNVGFEKIMLLQNPMNLDVSQVISIYVYEIGVQGAQFSYSTAIGLLNNIVNVTLVLFVNWIAKRVGDTGL